MHHEFDYVVIGGGSGGVRSARVAAKLGAKVALVESDRLGGTCVNVGCVPKKLFSYASHFSENFKDAKNYGWQVNIDSFDWSLLLTNKDKEIARLNRVYDQLLKDSGVEIFRGTASLSSPTEVLVQTTSSASNASATSKANVNAGTSSATQIKAKKILIATGGRPFVPSIPGKEHIKVSDDLFELDSLPKRILIYGSGYIAVEFASIFAGLGIEVDLVFRSERLIKSFDQDISVALAKEFEKSGINLWSNRTISEIRQSTADERSIRAPSYNVQLKDSTDDKSYQLSTDLVFFATGRKPNIEGLNLEQMGIKVDTNQAIEVNAHYQTSVPNIFAVGDVIDRVALTPVAIQEGAYVAHYLFNVNNTETNTSFGGKKNAEGEVVRDYHYIPTAVFTHPQIATVGLTEAEAKKQGFSLIIYQSQFKPLKNTLSGNPHRTYMKMIVDEKTGRVLGLHMLGEDAGEMIQGFAVAVKMGAKKSDFDATIGIHPTSAEEWVTMK